ncbi:FAD/NAD(P)-binding domain-containing protein, partial [Ramicandelaber brevisporus]
FDYVIVGAGVLGAPLAAALGQLGTRVCLIERDMSPPDRVAGEVLLDGGVDALLELGLGDCIEGIDAVPVMGQMFHSRDGDNVKLGITHNPYTGQPLKGRGFHNGRFVNKLRNCAKAEPNVTIIEATATDFVTGKSSSSDREVVTGVKYSTKNNGGNGVAMASRLVIIADGVFSNFRRKLAILAGHDVSETKEDTTAAFSACRPQFTSVMVSVTVTMIPEHMDEYLHNQTLRVNQTLYMPPLPIVVPGVIALGDAHNIRSPYTSSGMTVALWDVVHLRNILA